MKKKRRKIIRFFLIVKNNMKFLRKELPIDGYNIIIKINFKFILF